MKRMDDKNNTGFHGCRFILYYYYYGKKMLTNASEITPFITLNILNEKYELIKKKKNENVLFKFFEKLG